MSNRDKFRKGMWVVSESGRVGIFTNFLDFDSGEVHYTNDSGETIAVVNEPLSQLKQATYTDIPVCRRPDIEIARAKGY